MMAGLGLAGAILMGLMMGAMLLGGHRLGRKTATPAAQMTSAVCPVSGNSVAVSSAAVQATVRGKVYYFDDEEHQRLFVADPDRALRPSPDGGPR